MGHRRHGSQRSCQPTVRGKCGAQHFPPPAPPPSPRLPLREPPGHTRRVGHSSSPAQTDVRTGSKSGSSIDDPACPFGKGRRSCSVSIGDQSCVATRLHIFNDHPQEREGHQGTGKAAAVQLGAIYTQYVSFVAFHHLPDARRFPRRVRQRRDAAPDRIRFADKVPESRRVLILLGRSSVRAFCQANRITMSRRTGIETAGLVCYSMSCIT